MTRFKYKNAFSLVELLIVLAIIAVVSIMGLAVAKKGIERAYSGYYYNGFETILSVLNETEKSHLKDYIPNADNILTDEEKKMSAKITPNSLNNLNTPFIIALRYLFDTDTDSKGNAIEITENGLHISHVNGIEYNIRCINNGADSEEDETYSIGMSVPAANAEQKSMVVLLYRPNLEDTELKLIPTEIHNDIGINLADNAGLLPYMLDNTGGRMGKLILSYTKNNANDDIIRDGNGNPQKNTVYMPIDNQYSFKQAYCTVNEGDGISTDGTTYLSCTAADFVPDKNNARIRRIIRKN